MFQHKMIIETLDIIIFHMNIGWAYLGRYVSKQK
jgi:hypothetical protein